ncbi:MAG: ABC transporter substrate-binding protein [Proteobacteria bacterium]|nr:ABC transporter substrate-binding protein [Pseudomonadota bacterium]
MNRRGLLGLSASAAAFAIGTPRGRAADPVKVGLILPMTGPFQSTGRQVDAAARLYVQQNPAATQGRPVEIITRDDAGVPDTTRRLAQEFVVNEKVSVLAGFGLTPLALAAAPIATRAKVPLIVTSAATASITQASPFVVRASSTIAQTASIAGDWAARNKMGKVVTLVSDYGPGIDGEAWFNKRYTAGGGTIAASLRVPLQNPDFAPFLQKARDESPDGLFVFVPSGMGAAVMRQFTERGMGQSGIKLFGTGDLTDDDILNGMGDPALGIITSHFYSAAHDSAVNHAFVDAFGKANGGLRPNFMAVGGYDAMGMIYRALEKTGGNTDGEAMVDAIRGLSFESPRGPIAVDPATRELTQNVYMRKVEKRDGQLWNIEFETFPAVKDPANTKA